MLILLNFLKSYPQIFRKKYMDTIEKYMTCSRGAEMPLQVTDFKGTILRGVPTTPSRKAVKTLVIVML